VLNLRTVLVVALLLLFAALLCPRRPSEKVDSPVSIADLDLPVLIHDRHPVEHWMDVLREGGSGSREALWSLFYRNDRSAEVVDFLKAELEQRRVGARRHPESSGRRFLHREIDVVLGDWGVDHDGLLLEEYWDPTRRNGRFATPEEVFAPPAEQSFASDEELLDRLDFPVRRTSIAAAVTLIARQREVEAAVRSLFHHLHRHEVATGNPFWGLGELDEWEEDDVLTIRALRWAWEHAGTAAERALAGLLADTAEPIAVKGFLLDRVGLRSLSRREIRDERALPAVLVELARGGPLAASARRELFRIGEVSGEPMEGLFDESCSHLWRRPLERPVLEDHLATAVRDLLASDESLEVSDRLAAWVRAREDGGEPSAEILLDMQKLCFIQRAVQRSERVLEAARPWLLEALERPGIIGREALRLLCHAGESGPPVREAYRRRLEAMERFEPEDLVEVPCLVEHDAQTLESLLRVLRRARRKECLHEQIASGGLLDVNRDDGIARVYAAYLDRAGVDEWYEMWEDGYNGRCTISPIDSRMTRVCKLGIDARRKRALGQSVAWETAKLWDVLECGYHRSGAAPTNYYSEAMYIIHELDLDAERFLEWGIWFLSHPRNLGFPSYHCAAVAKVLERMGLSEEQQTALTWTFADVPIEQRGRALELHEMTGIERVVDLRHRLYRGDMSVVPSIQQYSRLSPLDEWCLTEALRFGAARDREEVLVLIRDLGLSFPGLDEAVRRCAGDCDDRVRLQARELCALRGW